MDPLVQQVQEWVNAEYTGRTGYGDPVAEDGITGWSTAYALTRALQIELGITNTSNNFGSGTKAAYESWGILEARYEPTSQQGINIVKILQGGMYCTGYNPGGFTGTFADGTAGAVMQLQADANLPIQDGRVYPYIFEAFLTMDAYVLTPGGDPRIRDMQRSLNNEYYTIAGVQPCDGHYQRNTNKALIYGIQTEEGIDPSIQTGTIGPMTRDRLPTLGVGSPERGFIRLLQYALYVNNFDPGVFDGLYGAGVRDTVREFQSFSQLTVDGITGTRTWLSLLQSKGDPTRRGAACDTITEVTRERAQVLISEGYDTVGRYLTNVSGGLNKKIQPGELETMFSLGLNVYPIYQTLGRDASYFHYDQGFEDAKKAYDAARSYGFPEETIIYFAVDFDALGYQIDNNIIPHFQGINARMRQLNQFYKIGIYGPRSVGIQASEAGVAMSSFVSSMSTGFSGNLGYPLPDNWAFDQISTITVGSGAGAIAIDNNIKSGRDEGASSINTDLIDNEPKVYDPFSLFSDITEGEFDEELSKPNPSFSYPIKLGAIEGSLSGTLILDDEPSWSIDLKDGVSISGKESIQQYFDQLLNRMIEEGVSRNGENIDNINELRLEFDDLLGNKNISLLEEIRFEIGDLNWSWSAPFLSVSAFTAEVLHDIPHTEAQLMETLTIDGLNEVDIDFTTLKVGLVFVLTILAIALLAIYGPAILAASPVVYALVFLVGR